MLVDKDYADISLTRQLDLLGISKSSYYYQPAPISPETLELLKLVDKIYTDYPTFGTRTMSDYLWNEYDLDVGRERLRGLYNQLQIRAIYQEPKATVSNPLHKKYPYLLRDVDVSRTNQVWSTDITYIPMKKGFIYLSAIIDWYSRYVLSWTLEIDMDAIHCVDLLSGTLDQYGKCEIFNTDQGSQYTSNIFTDCLRNNGVQISMDGRGRWADNIFIERLWRTVKYDCIYLNEFTLVSECRQILRDYFKFYNTKRPHHSLGGVPPAWIYYK